MIETPTSGSASKVSKRRKREALISFIECPECGADRVAKSHSRSRDRLVMNFLPKRPYRCMNCYHRFWKRESFFDNPGRIFSWIGVIVLFVGLAVLPDWASRTKVKPEPFSDFGSAPNAVPGQPPADLLEEGAVQPTIIDPQANISNESDSQEGLSSASDAFAESSKDSVADRPTDIQSEADSDDVAQPAPESEEANPAAMLEQLYTTEQLQQRLSLAKATAEQAEKENRQEQARLQRSVASEQSELQSLLKVDINFRIDSWRKAWEVGFIDDYLNFYSEKFTPENKELTRAQWVVQRKQRIRPSKKIDLSMNNFKVEFSENNSISTVSFDQVYKSGGYLETSRKELVLHKEQQAWKIVSETESEQEYERIEVKKIEQSEQ